MMKLFKGILIAGFLIYNFGFNAEGVAQDRPLRKINWGMTALSAAMWIPWIAKDAKIYEKHGLDVELVLLRGSGQTSAAMTVTGRPRRGSRRAQQNSRRTAPSTRAFRRNMGDPFHPA